MDMSGHPANDAIFKKLIAGILRLCLNLNAIPILALVLPVDPTFVNRPMAPFK